MKIVDIFKWQLSQQTLQQKIERAYIDSVKRQTTWLTKHCQSGGSTALPQHRNTLSSLKFTYNKFWPDWECFKSTSKEGEMQKKRAMFYLLWTGKLCWGSAALVDSLKNTKLTPSKYFTFQSETSVLRATFSCKYSVAKREKGRADCSAVYEYHSPVNISRSPDHGQLLGRMTTARTVLSLTLGFFFFFTEF